MIVHQGILNAGHYTCYIRPDVEDKWFKFNDSHVSEVSKKVAFNTGMGGYSSKFELEQLETVLRNKELEINSLSELKPACSLSDIIERRYALPI